MQASVGPEPALILKGGRSAGRRVPLPDGRAIVIGRSLEADVTFPDEPSLSRLHLHLDRVGDTCTVTDLGSANGTSVNGEPLEGSRQLQPGDTVICGDLPFAYEPNSRPEAPARIEAVHPPSSVSQTVPDVRRMLQMTAQQEHGGASLEALTGALAQVPLFRRLNPPELAAVAGAMTQRRYEAGVNIVTQGEDGHCLYVVLDGRATVETAGANGGTHVLAQLGPGGFFGEMTLLDGQPRSATVRAETRVHCALLPRWALEGLIRADFAMAMQLLAVLSIRLRSVERLLTA